MNEEAMAGSGGGKGISIAALICGLGAFIPGLCCGIVGIPAAILAIIFGAIGRNKGGGGIATAGLALGIIYIVVAVILMVVGVNMKEYQPGFMKDMNSGNSSFNNDGDNNDGNNDSGSNDGNAE